MDALSLRSNKPVAYDIDGNELHVGDEIERTQEQMDHYGYNDDLHRVGDVVVIDSIYTLFSVYGDELLGSLTFKNSSGSLWNSTLNLWRKRTN